MFVKKTGAVAGDLKREDFTLQENGARQEIACYTLLCGLHAGLNLTSVKSTFSSSARRSALRVQSDYFGLFRSWHNKRALDPEGPWRRLTLAIAYATEAHLFITDLNQSPFNVGTRLLLEDFTYEQVAELNRRYGSPLGDQAEVARYYRLVGGHPYLARRGFYEMAAHRISLAALEAQADHDDGSFSDHLRRLVFSLTQDAALSDVVRRVLKGQSSVNTESFYRLRSAGLMAGDSERDVRPRCQLYATYLERHLL